LKYLGLWGTRQVNINTAPRHVLEAALSFGSVLNAPKIAEAVIQQRKVKPVEDVNEVKKAVLGYSSVIEDCRSFLTATSTVFTIRVTAVSGTARATVLAAVTREGDKIEPIAVIRD
jgi:type II secretory pathway component PulK